MTREMEAAEHFRATGEWPEWWDELTPKEKRKARRLIVRVAVWLWDLITGNKR